MSLLVNCIKVILFKVILLRLKNILLMYKNIECFLIFKNFSLAPKIKKLFEIILIKVFSVKGGTFRLLPYTLSKVLKMHKSCGTTINSPNKTLRPRLRYLHCLSETKVYRSCFLNKKFYNLSFLPEICSWLWRKYSS